MQPSIGSYCCVQWHCISLLLLQSSVTWGLGIRMGKNECKHLMLATAGVSLCKENTSLLQIVLCSVTTDKFKDFYPSIRNGNCYVRYFHLLDYVLCYLWLYIICSAVLYYYFNAILHYVITNVSATYKVSYVC